MDECDFDKLIIQYETDGLEETMQQHLKSCETCRTQYEEYIKLTGALIQSKCDINSADFPEETLPDRLNDMVAVRKKQWLAKEVGKVLDFQGVTDKNDKQKQLKRILESEVEDLPLAAFPDDLDDKKDE